LPLGMSGVSELTILAGAAGLAFKEFKMDLSALQATLRQFAADRAWQPFHNPKNLAMALLVEAAELTEIFQWMTPDEAARTRDTPAVQQHLGEEMADVLLYLLQLADHTGIDLEQAVADKLIKNAQKYPPMPPA